MSLFDQKIVDGYQSIFNTPIGLEVLEDILTDLNFFSPVETEAQRVRLNSAHKLLAKLGVWNLENSQEFTEAIMKLPARYQEATKELEDV